MVAYAKPNIHKWPQTFQVRLSKHPSKFLDKPTDLLEIFDQMDDMLTYGWLLTLLEGQLV